MSAGSASGFAVSLSLLAVQPQARSRRYLNQSNSEGFQADLKVPGAPKLTLVAPFNYTLMIALPEAELKAQGMVLDEAPVEKSRKWRNLGLGLGGLTGVASLAGGAWLLLRSRRAPGERPA